MKAEKFLIGHLKILKFSDSWWGARGSFGLSVLSVDQEGSEPYKCINFCTLFKASSFIALLFVVQKSLIAMIINCLSSVIYA